MGSTMSDLKIKQDYKSVLDFKSENFIYNDDIETGLFLSNHYIPEELVINILSFLDPKELLQMSMVCKRWCRIVRSNLVWKIKYERKTRRKAKHIAWFAYYCLFTEKFFDKNLLKNGNGQDEFHNWEIVRSMGDGFVIEATPHGADPLPENCPDFQGQKSCFATSFGECEKFQIIPLNTCNLFSLVLDYYKPTIYVSEWWCGRFDCGCVYTLRVYLRGERKQVKSSGDLTQDILKEFVLTKRIDQWAGKEWQKVIIPVVEYPEGVQDLIFIHAGKDTQFWKGHYGSKMAGGVVQISFDSIAEKKNDMYLGEVEDD